jgi:glutamine synthetase
MATAKEHPAVAAIRKSGAPKVKVAVSDIDGVLRGKYLHRDKFLGTAEPYPKGGFGFCDVVLGWDMMDVCYDNTTVTGWQHGFPDALARLDLDTARHVPWDNGVPFFLGEFVNADGTPHPVCPRQTLKRVLKRAENMGFQVMTGMEFEWYNFAETPQSWAAKKVWRPSRSRPACLAIRCCASTRTASFSTPSWTTCSPSVCRWKACTPRPAPACTRRQLDSARRWSRRTVPSCSRPARARSARASASCPASWPSRTSLCQVAAGHIHQSLSDGKSNLFFDAKAPRRMSKLFESYLAGQVACMMEFGPMIWPTINSYKRLVDGFWAPVKPTWGMDNRTASFRVIAGSPKATRLETRCPGADVNPYLAMAAVIAAGLDGVEKGLKLTAPPITGTNQGAEHIARAPRTLIETTRNFRESTIARDWLGDTFVDHFAATREWEWRQWLDAVTDWEMKRYFEII